MKFQNIVLSVLFLASIFAMYLVNGRYPYVYAAGALATAFSLYYRITLIAQASGLVVLLVFASTASPTLPYVLLSIGILSVFIYAGNAFGGAAWKMDEQGLEITERRNANIAYTVELGRVMVPAALLAVVTAVLAGGIGVKADNLLIFIFLISLGLLLLGLISRHVSGQ